MRTTHGFTAGRLAWRSLALSVLLVHPAAAQRENDDNEDRDQRLQRHLVECRAAAKVIARGVPRHAQQKAYEVITGCNDDAPAAYAVGMRRLAATRDTAALRPMITAAAYVSDTGFFNAALDVAGRSSATNEARAVALLVAARQLRDRISFDLPELVAATEPLPCQLLLADHSLRSSAGTPLSPDASGRLRVLVRAVLAAPASPILLANAARCAMVVTGP